LQANANPSANNSNPVLPYNITAQNSSSTMVTIINQNGEADTLENPQEMCISQQQIPTIHEEGLNLTIGNKEAAIMETSVENEEVNQALGQSQMAEDYTTPEARQSDTPSPLEFCEGQIYTLNKAMQFQRLHTKIGEKFVVTSKGLEKIEDDDRDSNQQVLILKGKFSFKFETV
jgi:hypothetical protein